MRKFFALLFSYNTMLIVVGIAAIGGLVWFGNAVISEIDDLRAENARLKKSKQDVMFMFEEFEYESQQLLKRYKTNLLESLKEPNDDWRPVTRLPDPY